MEQQKENKLMLILWNQKTFAGRYAKEESSKEFLLNAVEMLNLVNPQNGGVAVLGLRLGNMEIPKEGIIRVEMDKFSLYWEPYFRTVSGLKAV